MMITLCTFICNVRRTTKHIRKRSFSDRSTETVIPLYKSLVRPHLECCCQVWSPHYIKDIKLIEGVQRRATKLVHGMEKLPYDDRLKYLKLMRLDTRRERLKHLKL